MRQEQKALTVMSLSVSPGAPAVLVAVALGIVYVVWGSTYLAIRIAVEDMPPLVAMGWRFLAAGLVLGLVLAIRLGPGALRIRARELLACATMGLLLPVLGNGLVSVGENGGVPSGLTALLIAAVPLWVVCYRLISGDRPPRQTTFGVALGFAGLAMLVLSAGIEGGVPIGATLIVVMAPMFWSFGSWLSPRLSLPANPFVATAYEMACAGPVMLVMGMVDHESLVLHASTRSWLAWLYLVTFGSLLAFTAYVWVLRAAPISLVATYAYVNPVVAVFLGWLVVGESITTAIVVGGAVVVGSVAIVIASERPAARRPRLPEVADRQAREAIHAS
jgi:drug/metabolite transporter (DMT)-like permease